MVLRLFSQRQAQASPGGEEAQAKALLQALHRKGIEQVYPRRIVVYVTDFYVGWHTTNGTTGRHRRQEEEQRDEGTEGAPKRWGQEHKTRKYKHGRGKGTRKPRNRERIKDMDGGSGAL
eukprot:scaffold279590_cov30-Tisochrysis_lutea.AAC.1